MNRLVTIRACLCLLGIFLLAPAQAQNNLPVVTASRRAADADLLTLFTDAAARYKNEDYSGALEQYRTLILAGLKNGELYYNLGNCYFKLGMLGKAILSYRLAELYRPRDQDLKTNLAYAREMTRDKIESRQLSSFVGEFCFWYSKLNVRELLLLFLIINALCWICALIRLWSRNEYWRYLFLGTLAAAAVLAVSLGFKLYQWHYSADAVVITREVSVRAGNGIHNTVLFQLHDGVECRIVEQEQDWVKIELADGKRGWIEARWLGRCRLQSWPAPEA